MKVKDKQGTAKENKAYAIQCIEAAINGGANWNILCDTNGGCLPNDILINKRCYIQIQS